MSELKRYALSSAGRVFPDPDGNWVFHESARAALDALKAERVALNVALMQLATEREAHARTLAALSAIWETAASGGSVADDTDWAAVHDAIAAAKVTP